MPAPDTKHVVCYSGGHTSGVVAIEVARRFGAASTVLLNHDINPSVEDADVKRFKVEVAAFVGVPITYANMDGWDTKDQFDVVVEAGAFKVGTGTALCTNRLKTRPFEAWLRETFPDKNAVIYYGFDANEPARIQRRLAHIEYLGFKAEFPVALWADRTIRDTREVGIEPPQTYATFKHANCVGCLKAGRQHWYVTYCLRPDVFAKGKWAESEIGYTIIKDVSLGELEPFFAQMKEAGVVATEHVTPGRFWADARKRVGAMAEAHRRADQSAIPCECAA